MLGSLVIVPIVSLITQKGVPEDVEGKFACYDSKIVVSAKSSLNDK